VEKSRKKIVLRLVICMAISFLVNALFNLSLKSELTQKEYFFEADVIYSKDSTMELHYDSGVGFNQKQEVSLPIKRGQGVYCFRFNIDQGEQLKYVRLDFGSDINLNKVELNSVILRSKEKVLFNIKKDNIVKETGLLMGILNVDTESAIFSLNTTKVPYDPYITFNSVYDLISPKWLKIFLLVCPWLILFFKPVINWLKLVKKSKEYHLILIAFFIVSVLLKTAWVTFTALLLLVYALSRLYFERRIKFTGQHITIIMLFFIQLIFIKNGSFSDIDMALGFVIFPVIFSILDFSRYLEQVKEIYVNVFFVAMSIIIVAWFMLILYNGYFYGISMFNYFAEIKLHAHRIVYWLYYEHPTFISFFILIGFLFCQNLYEQKRISKSYFLFYGLFSFSIIMLLGSRFALVLFVVPFLYCLSIKNLIKYILPLILVTISLSGFFISFFDTKREQLWKMSWIAFKNNILFGYGAGSSKMILQNIEIANKAGFKQILNFNHSHNQYLTYFLETGVVGTLLVLISFAYLIKSFMKDNNKTMILLCFMVLLLMSIESPFETATPLYTISFILSVFSLKNSAI